MKFLTSAALCYFVVAFFWLPSPALGAASEQGVLEIQIKDHREAIDDFAKFNIAIDRILISPKAGIKFWQTGWKELTPAIATVDLTQYTGKKTARIFRGELPPGSFDALHLKIKNITALLKKTHRPAPVKNTVAPFKLSFQLPAKGETLLVLDLIATDFSDHPPRGYELGIGGYELYTDGKLIEKIPPG